MRYIIFFMLLLLVPFASAGLQSDVAVFEEEIESFVGERTLIAVVGDYASFSERMTLQYYKDNHVRGDELDVFNEEDMPENLAGKVVFLVGGETRNSYSKDVLSGNYTHHELSIGDLYLVEGERRYIVFSDPIMGANLPNTAVKRSPLALFLPERYIPLAATIIGFSLAWVWHIISALLVKIGKLFLSGKIMGKVKKKDIKHRFIGFKIFGIKIKLREWLSIFGAAMTFALALSYTKMVSLETVLALVSVSIVVNFIVYSVRNFSRLALDKAHNLHTEYKFWIYGAITTAITGWLGNALAMTGYITKEKHFKEEGKIQFKINLYTFVASLVFFASNLLWPSLILQMAAALSISIAFVQMMPFSPFSGKGIWKWKKGAWISLMIPMALFYFVTQLVI